MGLSGGLQSEKKWHLIGSGGWVHSELGGLEGKIEINNVRDYIRLKKKKEDKKKNWKG